MQAVPGLIVILKSRRMSSPSKVNSKGKPGFVFAADLGGTHLRSGIVDDSGRISFRSKHLTPKGTDPNEIVGKFLEAARECERRDSTAFRAVSVVVPGTVDVKGEVILHSFNLPCLNGFPMKQALERELGWPIVLENDANAAAIGEMWQGAARGARAIICVTLGTGVGGGIVLDGKLWRGADGCAGEIGHTCVEPFSEIACTCGNRGCLEVFASATAIVRMAREALPRYPHSSLKGEKLSSELLHDAALSGDELALEVFKKMGTYLGIGLANLVNMFHPEVVVIAGGVVGGWRLFADHMKQQVAERSFPAPASQPRIVECECGDNAGLLGAAHLAFTVQS